MGATITKGTTFTNAATAGGMAALVESATIAAIDRSCARSTEITLATLGALPPANPADREVWQTSLGNALASYYLAGTAWRGALPVIVPYTLVGSVAVIAGDALGSSGSTLTTFNLAQAAHGNIPTVFGIALAVCAVGAKSLCVISGPALARISGSVSAGTALALSQAAAGKLQDATGASGGGSWKICGNALLADSGGFAWVNLRR